uniref:type II toxin-antitoxin system ParD family antitoxin n=1 Tax=Pararhizobium sp. IMCC3301 TaxID=3067904 RepID=UPI00274204AF|nr:type II toxin-antitoxin system ParD family antitoxin [Pararhizobium sp. IMCC3301]
MAVSADLGKPLEAFLDRLVKSGRYRSRSEVLREGLRLVQEREARLADLYAKLDDGMKAADEGRVRPAAAVFDEMLARLEALPDK